MALADRFPRARRLSSVILVIAAVAVYFGVIDPRVGEDHAVSFELQGPTQDITRIEAVWTKVGDEEEPASGSTLNFDAGTAPRSVRTSVYAADGEYWLDLTLVRGGHRSTLRRRIALDGEEITVFVPVPLD